MAFGSRFAVLIISPAQAGGVVTITTTTDIACHKWLRWTEHPLRVHLQEIMKRGWSKLAEPYYCFVVSNDIEQNEPGDTLVHTFTWPGWSYCVTRHYYFYGYEGGVLSPSTWGIYKYHYGAEAVCQDFYPDAHPEITSVDGQAMKTLNNQPWAVIHDGVGSSAFDDGQQIQARVMSARWADWYYNITRAILLFDTSAIPGGASVITAKLELYGFSAINTFAVDPGFGVYASTPASNTAVIIADYLNTHNTLLTNIIKESALDGAGVNTFTFTGPGLSAIQPGGITKLAVRESDYDAPNIPIPWESNKTVRFGFWAVEKGGMFRPKLTVCYMA